MPAGGRRNPEETRARILAAADELFYGEGILSVGVDALAERAGVTKRTLYYHFRSKDDLIAAYLDVRGVPMLERYRSWSRKPGRTLRERLLYMFQRLGERAADPKWKGCGYARAAAELAGLPGHPAIAVAVRYKRDFETWLHEMLAEEGIAPAKDKARQIMVIMEGAITMLLIHRDPAYADAAGRAAVGVLDAPAEETGQPLAAAG